MNCYAVNIGPATVFIETQTNLLVQQQRLQAVGMPILAKVSASMLTHGPLIVHKEIDPTHPVTVTYDSTAELLFVSCAASRLDEGATLLHYAHLLLEAQLQLKGYVTAHCAAIELDGSAVLLLGKTGAGKTTTAIKLCKDMGARLIGNDLCVLGLENKSDAVVISGTKQVLLRLLTAQRDLQELLSLFPDIGSPDPWTTKIPIPATKLGIGVHEGTCRIRHAFYVHVDSTQEKHWDTSYNTLILKLYLYENFSRYIRGTTTPILLDSDFRLGPYLPSFDSPEAHTQRSALIEHLVDEVGIRYIAGSARSVVDRIGAIVRTPQHHTLGMKSYDAVKQPSDSDHGD